MNIGVRLQCTVNSIYFRATYIVFDLGHPVISNKKSTCVGKGKVSDVMTTFHVTFTKMSSFSKKKKLTIVAIVLGSQRTGGSARRGW